MHGSTVCGVESISGPIAQADLGNPAEPHAEVVCVPLAMSLVVLFVLFVEDRQPLLPTCLSRTAVRNVGQDEAMEV